MPIDVSDCDAAWPGLADSARTELQSALPGVFLAIEHFGSTSVPGLAAKPTIDLMAAAVDLDLVRQYDLTLGELGYHRVDAGIPGRLFYVRDLGGRHTHHLHVVPVGDFATRNELLLRDYLRTHPEDAARYAALKRQLGAIALSDDEYTRAKTDLIQELTDAARAERGLPSIPVWEH
jgi:GrpB-like predicted nucleotidyltransferase (UPF0157 family)